MLTHEEERKIVLAFASMSKLVWSVTQVIVYQLKDDPVCTSFIGALKEGQQEMIDALRELGVNVEPFEDYDIKVAASEHPDN